jgi:hypothetical protein
MDNIAKLKKSSRRNAWLTIYGVTIIIGSLVYSYINLNSLEKAISEKTNMLMILEKSVNNLQEKEDEYESILKIAESKLDNLQKTQNSILDFLVSITNKSNVHLLDPSVDWTESKKQLNALPAGDRKNVLLNAILLAWKDIPFSMGKEGLHGFDSPRFLRFVLQSVGVEVENEKGKRMSDTLMEKFKKVDNPMPGDLAFFQGQVGSFGFILLSVGKSDSDHVGIGTLQKVAPLQIISMGNINTPYFPLKGYYRVIYPDEEVPNKKNELGSGGSVQ